MKEKYFGITQKGVNVCCKLYTDQPRSFRRAAIFCHGFGGHKDTRAAARFAERVLSKYKDIAVCAFDWPCHGDDVKKKLRLDDCTLYLELVMAYLKEQFQAEELYVYATSFGGYLILKYLHEKGNPFRKVALRCPAVPLYRSITGSIMTEDEKQKIAKGREVPVGFDRKVPVDAEFLREIQEADISGYDYLDYAEDMLIVHGTADELIPFEEVRQFADNSLIEFLPVEGADHRFRDPGKMDYAISEIIKFYQL